jgi:glycerol-3-phosphate dehydrogenase
MCVCVWAFAEIMLRVLGGAERMAFLSGPTFAAELMAGHPSGVVVASSEMGMAARAAELFRSPVLRVYTTTDVVGVEVGGALKNVFALMAGAVEGMGFGYNSAAMMVTLACREMNQVSRP